MSNIVTVYATFPGPGEAERIARALVGERLAACANLLGPCRSIYRWEGEVQDGEEVAALFKTSAERSEPLLKRLAELHSYDIPAVVVWPIEAALPAYTDWVAAEVQR